MKKWVAEASPQSNTARARAKSLRPQLFDPAWQGSDIAFNLRADGNDTTLLFAHRGFPRTDEGFASATTRWGFYLISLKHYLEAGKGTPNPDDIDL